MLIQTLFLMATMVVLAGAILTSTLVSAKAVFHQTMLTKSQTAMTDATADFVSQTKQLVNTYGSDPKYWPVPAPTVETLPCSSSTAATCPIANISWGVTGSTYSGTSTPIGTSGGAPADASNLATTISEQRISATISVQITNPKGNELYAERSRQITARVFDASPWVIITGSRDSSSQDGNYHAGEGDTGGANAATIGGHPYASPVPGNPSTFTDTRIITSIDCSNSIPEPTGSPVPNAYFNYTYHPYGNIEWAYESSCYSGPKLTSGVPTGGYKVPTGTLFVAQPGDAHSAWVKNDEDTSGFPR